MVTQTALDEDGNLMVRHNTILRMTEARFRVFPVIGPEEETGSDPGPQATALQSDGALCAPDGDAYTTKLRDLLVTQTALVEEGNLMVRHDPISRMTESRFRVFPVIGPDCNVLMTEWPERQFHNQADDLQALHDARHSED
jgi:hypothetical protein